MTVYCTRAGGCDRAEPCVHSHSPGGFRRAKMCHHSYEQLHSLGDCDSGEWVIFFGSFILYLNRKSPQMCPEISVAGCFPPLSSFPLFALKCGCDAECDQ